MNNRLEREQRKLVNELLAAILNPITQLGNKSKIQFKKTAQILKYLPM
jgi:hypothetical protein